jgi:hypothetical protein
MKLRLPAFRAQSALMAGALLAPVLLVQVVRLVVGSTGPTTAAAVTPGAATLLPGMMAQPTDPIAAATPRLDVQQRKAVEWLKEARAAQRVVNSPFPVVTVKPAAPITVTESAAPVQVEVPLPPEIKSLTLTSVLRASSGRYATLRGKVVTTGDEVIPGWNITDIDVEKRVVTVEGPGGRTVYVSQDVAAPAAPSRMQPSHVDQTPTPLLDQPGETFGLPTEFLRQFAKPRK